MPDKDEPKDTEQGIPERIFLQTGTDKREGYEGVEWSAVSWWRERIYESDIEYVRVHKRKRKG